MKLIPIILIGVGILLLVTGLIGIFVFIHIVCDSPEEIRHMKVGDEIKVYGEIAFAPTDKEVEYKADQVTPLWSKYNYTFSGGGYFYSENTPKYLGIENGKNYVVDIEYKASKHGSPEGPHLLNDEKGKDSVSGSFIYRLPGIVVVLIGVVMIGLGIFFLLLDFKKSTDEDKERKRKKDNIDRQMELLEKEIEMALHVGGGAPPGQLQYHPPPGQMPPKGAPGQPPARPPMGGMPPGQMPPKGAPGQPPARPPMGGMPPGQMPPQGVPGQAPRGPPQ